ncbi:MAG: hypothetical protein NW216_05780 [Hyphomicrobium sp.]|nr:hypothetical protein [Hyphomicrobium sp.]
MGVIKRLLAVLIAAPAAILLITLAVANRHSVEMVLDPFRAEPLVTLKLPFYVFLLASLIAGVVLGGFATWFSQGRFRKLARVKGVEARRWHNEADRLARERDQSVAERSRQITQQPHPREAA